YSGRDDAEKLKYAIKDAVEEYGIEYVLLVGGLSSPIKSDTWLVPVRYDHLSYGDEKKTLCDLYFADIYM
ncbi:MAG: peptidase C25, partial [Thermoplasmata archaeon]